MRMIGLDVGERRVGVAVSDSLGLTAQPRETIYRDELFLEKMRALVRETGAEKIVVGLPLLMDGTEGKQARLVRGFAEELGLQLDLNVEFQDERLTTREAESVLMQAETKTGERRGALDIIAATLILQKYIDGKREAGN